MPGQPLAAGQLGVLHLEGDPALLVGRDQQYVGSAPSLGHHDGHVVHVDRPALELLGAGRPRPDGLLRRQVPDELPTGLRVAHPALGVNEVVAFLHPAVRAGEGDSTPRVSAQQVAGLRVGLPGQSVGAHRVGGPGWQVHPGPGALLAGPDLRAGLVPEPAAFARRDVLVTHHLLTPCGVGESGTSGRRYPPPGTP